MSDLLPDGLERARALDLDGGPGHRADFSIPTNGNVGAIHIPARAQQPCAYLCGNSLGLMHAASKSLVTAEMGRWADLGVDGHFRPPGRGWVNQVDSVHPVLGEIVGASPAEIACMATLTTNLHLMMDAFYKPTPTRFKILCEAKAFPSDQYAFTSQALRHSLDPKAAVIELEPRQGEHTLRHEDILEFIAREGDSIAVVLFSGVQYYTGQAFPIKEITSAAHSKGCICGWDLAHAVGNIPLSLHDWDVDFAVWCSYKYLNAGPGAIGGLFLNNNWNGMKPRAAGWWGHDLESRFLMPPTFSPIQGAQGWQQSNPSALNLAALQGSLQAFKYAGGISALRAKSIQLTGFLENLLLHSPYHFDATDQAKRTRSGFSIITPSQPERRGCQLSILIQGVSMEKVFDYMKGEGVVGDERRPDVIRLAPTPLYNTFEDCHRAAVALNAAFRSLTAES